LFASIAITTISQMTPTVHAAVSCTATHGSEIDWMIRGRAWLTREAIFDSSGPSRMLPTKIAQ